MKILIVGGAGFIGSFLASELAKRHSLVILDHHKPQDKRFPFLVGDYSNNEMLKRALDKIEVVYHLAWSSTPASRLSWSEEVKQNVNPSQRLIDAAKNFAVKQFVFLSSAGTVYGKAKPPFKERQKPKPINNYGRAKLAVEQYLKGRAEKKFKATVLRATNAIGLGQKLRRGQGVVPAMITAAKKNKTFWLYGESRKDYIAVEDLVAALIKAREQKTIFEIFNVGSGEVLSILDIICMQEKAMQRPLRVKKTPPVLYDNPYVQVDIAKIKRALGWRPRFSVKESLSQLFQKELRS